jgi:hypothetical protein
MANSKSFNEEVAGRTRVAIAILGDPVLLAVFKALGGTERDLEIIRDTGLAAEAASHGQASASHAGVGATAEYLSTFRDVQREYNAVMGVTAAVKTDLEHEGAKKALITKVGKILVIEVQVSFNVVPPEEGGKKKVKSRRSQSQEAMRAEIEKDANELVALTEVHPALASRGVTVARLQALADAAKALSAQLGERTKKKGAAKGATTVEALAVTAQRHRWGGIYRLLRALAQKEPQVALLLRAAAR